MISDMKVPRISVLTPVYNTQEKHLRECIESILKQTYQDFEFILLNDASTDPNVEKVILSYDDSRIIYAVNEKNLGISSTRNRLIDMARGEYLAIFDHDDISMPDRLERCITYLDENQDVGIVSSVIEVIDDKGGLSLLPRPENDKDIQLQLLTSCCVVHSAAMLRKNILLRHGIHYERLFSPAEDYALFCRLLGKTKYYNFQRPLIQYRDHTSNTSHKQSDAMAFATQVIQEFAKRDNPELWDFYRLRSFRKIRHRLFNLIPIIKVEEFWDKKKYYLFGKIPLWSVTNERWRKL